MKLATSVEKTESQPPSLETSVNPTAGLSAEVQPDLQPEIQKNPHLTLETLAQQFAEIGKFATDLYAQSAVLLAKIQAELPAVDTPTLGMERDRFVEHLSTNYGFTQEAGASMYKTLEAIEEKFPNLSQQEKDYLFNRLVGGFVYDGFKWNSTAGELKDFFPKQTHQEMFATLGIDEAEYNKLRYQMRIQNQICSGQLKEWNRLPNSKQDDYLDAYNKAYQSNLTTGEFKKVWNAQRIDMIDKGDFAHQSITTATILYDTPNFTLAKVGVVGGEKKVDEMSGWLGDATIQTKDNGWLKSKTVQFGADDYIADLDAANITHLMQRDNKGFLKATDYYYNSYIAEGNSRATLFTEHTPYEYVEKKVLNEFGYFYSLEDLKNKQPEAYNFLMSVKHGDYRMGNY